MEKIPLKKAIAQLCVITLMISGTAALGLLFYRYVLNQYAQEDAYRIVAITQTTSDKEPLKSVYLAELLDLSTDIHTNLYRFNAREARRKLLSNPLISEAKIKKVRPGTLSIRYTMRKPVAFLMDYSNTVIDEDGFLFPFKPFFTPKRLPEIYMGLTSENVSWGQQLKGQRADLAQDVLEYVIWNCCSDSLHLKRIDVSKANAESYGQCQIVVIMENQVMNEVEGHVVILRIPHILRLDTKNYIEGMEKYELLRPHLHDENALVINGNTPSTIELPPIIVDLRLPNLAYFTTPTRTDLKTAKDAKDAKRERNEKNKG